MSFLIMPLSFQAEEYTGDDQDDYDRIYKEDGLWYGIIEVGEDDIELWPDFFHIKFSRDTQELSQIKIDYTVSEYCSKTQDAPKFFSCFLQGERMPGYDGTEDIYQKDKVGVSFGSWLSGDLSDAEIVTLDNEPSWDYRIWPDIEGPLKKINVVEFTYKLTDEETDNVNAEIQQQYDDEVLAIMQDGSLDLEDKQTALDNLNQEYAEYTLEYDEDITSLCEGDGCTVEIPDKDPIIDPAAFLDDIKTFVISVVVVVSVGLIVFTVGLEVLADLVGLLLSAFLALVEGITIILTRFIWEPLYRGIRVLSKLIYDLVFWWI